MAGNPQFLELENYGADDEADENRCEWPDCAARGDHRAPRSRNEINSYRWFCIEHARLYNKRWNYFTGMSENEVEADRRADTVWRRPSWPLGDGPPTPEHAQAFWRGDFSDPFNAFGGVAKGGRAYSTKGGWAYSTKAGYDQADAANGNNNEDRIKDINHAYQVIVDFLSP